MDEHESLEEQVERVTANALVRGKGFIKDAEERLLEYMPLRAMLGARVRVATQASLEQYILQMFDQGPTNSCVGWAFARAIHMRCAIMGVPIPWPSVPSIYTPARAAMRTRSNLYKLGDNGCDPASAVEALSTWGVAKDTDWPFDPKTINDEPDFGEEELASCFKIEGTYLIDSDGTTMLAEVEQALAAGYPVPFGMTVDGAYEQWNGKDVIDGVNLADGRGGHMQCIVGFEQSKTYGKVYRVCNSWGTGWGDNGMANVSAALLTSQAVFSKYALSGSAIHG